MDIARVCDTHAYVVDNSWRGPHPTGIVGDPKHSSKSSIDQLSGISLAGDLLPNPPRTKLIATGLSSDTIRQNMEGGMWKRKFRVEYVVASNEYQWVKLLWHDLGDCGPMPWSINSTDFPEVVFEMSSFSIRLDDRQILGRCHACSQTMLLTDKETDKILAFLLFLKNQEERMKKVAEQEEGVFRHGLASNTYWQRSSFVNFRSRVAISILWFKLIQISFHPSKKDYGSARWKIKPSWLCGRS